MRSRFGAVVTGAVLVTAVVTVASILLWRELDGWRSPAVTGEVCNTDPTLSGFQGYCVQRRHHPAGLFTDEHAWLYFVAVQDGQQIPRMTVAPYPFGDVEGEFRVRFDEQAVTVSNADGITAAYPRAFYVLD